MPLIKYEDYYPNYREILGADDLKGFEVYADTDEKIGKVAGVLVDEQQGMFRYLIIVTNLGIFREKVLLPVGLAHINFERKSLKVERLTAQRIEELPEFSDNLSIEQDYEDRVREIYRPLVSNPSLIATNHSEKYNYDLEPYFYELPINSRLREYEERLISSKFLRI